MANSVDMQDQRYAPPGTPVAEAAGPEARPEMAGRGRRLLATLLDIAIFYGIVVLSVAPFDHSDPAKSSIGLAFIVGFVGLMVVNVWLLVQRGQTLGKLALGLRIVNRDGERATAWQLVGKRVVGNALLTMIPLVGGIYALVDVCMIFRESRLCLHDDIAGTMVVRA